MKRRHIENMIEGNGSLPRRRTAASGQGTERKSRSAFLLTTGFLLFSLSEAHLDSTDLRYESIMKAPVLVWPSYDFSIDSAALLGPIALCLRGGAVNESESIPESSIASPVLEEESSSSSPPQMSVEDNATQQVETLGAGSETVSDGSSTGTTLEEESSASSSSPLQTSVQDNATQQVETLGAESEQS
jgi:hypothetical protein